MGKGDILLRINPAKIAKLAGEVPGILELLTAQGVNVPAALNSAVPWAMMGGQLLSKYFGDEDFGEKAAEGLPDTGPLGRGRMQYLRSRRLFKDLDVVRACELATDEQIGTGGKKFTESVNYTLLLMYPNLEGGFNDQQTRKAIDQVLEGDIVKPSTCDKIGDLIYFTLKHPDLLKTGTKQVEP